MYALKVREKTVRACPSYQRTQLQEVSLWKEAFFNTLSSVTFTAQERGGSAQETFGRIPGITICRLILLPGRLHHGSVAVEESEDNLG